MNNLAKLSIYTLSFLIGGCADIVEPSFCKGLDFIEMDQSALVNDHLCICYLEHFSDLDIELYLNCSNRILAGNIDAKLDSNCLSLKLDDDLVILKNKINNTTAVLNVKKCLHDYGVLGRHLYSFEYKNDSGNPSDQSIIRELNINLSFPEKYDDFTMVPKNNQPPRLTIIEFIREHGLSWKYEIIYSDHMNPLKEEYLSTIIGYLRQEFLKNITKATIPITYYELDQLESYEDFEKKMSPPPID